MRTILNLSFIMLLFAALPAHTYAQVEIVATTPALAQIAKAVCGETCNVTTLAKVGQDPHFVAPKPTLARHLAKADLLFSVGLALESGWLPPLISLSRNSQIRIGGTGYFAGSDYVDVLGKNIEVNRSMGDVHPEGNPHWWIDPAQTALVSTALAKRLAKLDPTHADIYANQAKKFVSQLNALITKWKPVLKQSKPIVTYHDSYRYFVERFDIKVAGFIEPKPGVEPSTRHLDDLISMIESNGVQQIWVEPYHHGRISKRIAALSGAKLLIMTDATAEEGAAGYLHMIEQLLHAAKGKTE